MKKRILSIFLAALMVVSLLPVTASAEPDYFTITNTSEEAANVTWKKYGSPDTINLQYSIDGGDWQSITPTDGGTQISLPAGKSVKFKNDTKAFSTGGDKYYSVTCDKPHTVSGNVMTLLDGKGEATSVPSYAFTYLFTDDTNLTSAKDLKLPATTLANYCYMYMFNNCKALVDAPALPATTLKEQCYKGMFQDCKALVTAPALPAMTLATSCYDNMFNGCTSLKNAPALPATKLANSCYRGMFQYCEALENAPALLATTLVQDCYRQMFSNCKALNSLTIGFSAFPTNATSNWLNKVPTSCVVVVPDNFSKSYTAGPNTIPESMKIVKASDVHKITNARPETAAETNNGYLTVDKEKGLNEDLVTVIVSPNEGYELKANSLLVKYNNGSADQTITPTQDEQDTTKYTFTMPNYSVTVTAEFAAHTHGSGESAITFQPWKQTDSLPTEGSWYLTDDVTLSAAHEVTGTLNLCLNDKVLDLKKLGNSNITVAAGARLNLFDCGKTVRYYTRDDNDQSDTYGLWTLAANQSTPTDYTTTGGVITGGTASGVNVRVMNGLTGTFNMYGGNIVGNTTISGGGGVNVQVIASGSVTFNMYGGNIVGNYSAKSGGGVNVTKSATFNMTGGSIEENTAHDYGGGVNVVGALNMSGGSICGNNVILSGDEGGGIYYSGTNATVTLGGTAQITGNTKGIGEEKITNNLFLADGKTVTLGNGIDDGMNGVAVPTDMSVGVTKFGGIGQFTTAASDAENAKGCFFSDKADYAVKHNKGTDEAATDDYLELAYAITNGAPESSATSNHGYLTIDKEAAAKDETVTITVVPSDGYQFKKSSLKAYRTNLTTLSVNLKQDETDETKYTFKMSDYAVTVTAEFEEVPHTHSFTYSASGAVLTATCTAGCTDGYDETPLTITLTGDVAANAAAVKAWNDAGAAAAELKYYAKDDTEFATPLDTLVTSGKYVVKATVSDKTASLEFDYVSPYWYLDPDPETGKVELETLPDVIVENETADVNWSGWVFVPAGDPLKIDAVVTLTDDVNIILADGASLAVTEGITSSSKTLTVYGQTLGSGKLTTTETVGSGSAEAYGLKGNLTVNGGVVNISGTCTLTYSGFGVNGNVTVNGGSVDITGAAKDSPGYGVYGSVTVSGGNVTISGASNNISSVGVSGSVEVSGGDVTISGTGNGLNSFGVSGSVTVSGGDVTISGTGGDYGCGVYSFSDIITVTGNGILTVNGSTLATNLDKTKLDATVEYSDADDGKAYGKEWDGKTNLTQKYLKLTPKHVHSFTYEADGAVLTATCGDADGKCKLPDKKLTLTLTKNTAENYYVYDGNAKTVDFATDEAAAWKAAVGSDAPSITYTAKEGSVLTDDGKAVKVGSYTATVTVDTNKTATLDFTIDKATPTVKTVPTASAITYGDTLEDSSLTDGVGSVDGTFAWTTSTTSPAVSDSEKTEYEVTFTPTDTANYATATCKVKVKVNKANYADTYSSAENAVASGNLKAKNGSTVEITLPEIPTGASYGTVSNENTSLYTVDETSKASRTLTITAAKDFDETTEKNPTTFKVAVTPDGNHNGYDITVTITPVFKTVVTIAADPDGFTYGETDKTGYKNASAKVDSTDVDGLAATLIATYYKETATAGTYETTGSTEVPKNAGNYKVTLSVPESNDAYTGSADVLFTIAKKEIEIIWAEDDFTYDGTNQTSKITASYKDIGENEHSLVVAVKQSDAVTAFENAGEYTAEVTGFDTANDSGYANYALPVTVTKTYTMKQKPVTVLGVTMQDKVYNGKTDDAVISDESGNAVFEGFYDGASLSLDPDSVTGEYASPSAGSQKVTLGGNWVLRDASGNYKLADSGHVTYAFGNITKAAQTTAPTAPEVSGETVTVNADDREKKLEYSLDGESAWVSVPTLDRNGAFTLSGLAQGSHTIYLRAKETNNFYASPSVNTAFELTRYSVAYNANGGVGSIASQTANSGSSVTVKSGSAMSRTGYTFNGWNTKADGTGTAYAAGSTISDGATLYAQWTANEYTVQFNANGGSGTMESMSFTYDAAQELSQNLFTHAGSGYHFAGWAASANGPVLYADKQSVKNLVGSGTVTLYAIWAQEVYTVKVNITSPQAGSVQVKLQQGNAVYAGPETVTMTNNGSSFGGSYSFTYIPVGTYNLVAKQTVTEDPNVTMTQLVVLTDNTEVDIVLPASGVNSELDVKENTLPTVVGGLDAEAESNREIGKDITVTMTVEKKEEQELAATAKAEDKETQEAISEIKATANGKSLEFMNIEIKKITAETGKDDVTVPINETKNVLELVFSYEMNGKRNIEIYREHDGDVHKFTELNKKPDVPEDQTFYVDKTNHLIYIYAKLFSTYAIGYEQESGGSSTGGGGGSSSYAVESESAKNGTLSTDKKSASSGSTVTITVAPDKGYTLETLTVLDKNGKEVEVKNLGNNKFSFKMPSGKVSISATFMEDNSMLNFFVDVKATDYYYDAVLWAAENDITKGTDAVHFSPNAPVTRAQVVTFLWRAAGKPVVNYAMSFADVSGDAYYTEAVRWAVAEGITKGTSDTTFSPDKVCTRGQIVTFLARFAGVEDDASGYSHGFTDVKATDYYNNAVAWAKDNKVTEGTSATTFSPNVDCTRAQVVTFLYRWMVK